VSAITGSNNERGHVDGTADKARFNDPSAVICHGDAYLVADTYNHCLRKVMADGRVSTVAVIPQQRGAINGGALSCKFTYPRGLALDDKTGDIYISEKNAIRKLTQSGVVSLFCGSSDATAGQVDGVATAARFRDPSGLCIDNARRCLFVADRGNRAIRCVTLPPLPVAPLTAAGTVAGTATTTSAVPSAPPPVNTVPSLSTTKAS